MARLRPGPARSTHPAAAPSACRSANGARTRLVPAERRIQAKRPSASAHPVRGALDHLGPANTSDRKARPQPVRPADRFDARPPNPIQPDRIEPTPDQANPAGAFHGNAPSQEGRTGCSVNTPQLQDGRTDLRPNIEPFQPNEPRGRRTCRQAGSNDRPNQAGPYQRTPPPAKASSRASFTSPAGPRSFAAPAWTREDRKTAERHRWAPAVRTIDSSSVAATRSWPTNPPASSRTAPFHRNDQQSVPAERHPVESLVQVRRVGAVFASPPPVLSTLYDRANEPNPQPPHATNAGSSRARETRSTVRVTVTLTRDASAIACRSPHAAWNATHEGAANQSSFIAQAGQPESGRPLLFEKPAKAHRRTVHPIIVLCREAGVQSSRLGSMSVCGAFSIRPSCIRPRRGSRWGSVGLNWV